MDVTKVADNTTGIHADDSTIYLFGSELYCGWCLESFTCPVRLKIHCHIEHLATCSCGERYRDRETLCKHVARSGCHLPPPFKWSHFLKLPCSKVTEVCSNEAVEGTEQLHSLNEDQTTDEKSSNKSGVLVEDSEKTNVTMNRKMLLKKHILKGDKESCLQTFEQQEFCFGLCPVPCTYRSDTECHTQQKHRENIEKSLSVNSCLGVSGKRENCIAVENVAVTATRPGALYECDVTLESTVAEKSEHVNPSIACFDISQKVYYKKDLSNDIPFIVSCFSSSLDGKLLYCDLCSDEFGEWKAAAMHVYSSHLSSLEQSHDACVDVTNNPQLSGDSSAKKLADNAACNQLQKLHSAVPCDVSKSISDVCNGDMQLNVTEHSSVNSECNTRDTSVDTSTIPFEENVKKHKFTTDECNIMASALFKLFNCWNFGNEAEIANGRTPDTHSSSVKRAVTAPVLSKKLPSASNAKATKAASSDMVAAMQLLSRKCKFCHRICSSRPNCERHEAVCYRILTKSKYSIETIRKIRGSNIFYCSRCGFSDADQYVVNEHLMEAHTVSNKRVRVKPQPGHDYIGNMKLATDNFQCTLCGSHQQSRSKMLIHLHRHSSLAALPKGMCTIRPESTAVKKEGTKRQNIQSSVTTCARSCPQCFRSFSSVAKYLSHRAVCRAIQHRQRVEQHGSICKYSYLFQFCKETSDGQWKCKLCQQCSRRRRDLYKHIREKHSQVQNTKLEAQCFWKELSEKTANGQWQCRLCKHCFAYRYDAYKHIRTNHAAELSKNQEIAKRNDISGFCEETSDGRFQCTLCTCLRNNRSYLLRHIRAVHFKMFLPTAKKSSAIPLCSTVTASSSSVRKDTFESTALLSSSSVPKSQSMHFVKPCPNCSRVFTRRSGYQNHVKWCCKRDRFVERISSGIVRCRLCNSSYRKRGSCIKHLRQKHLLTNELICHTRDNAGTDVTGKTESTSTVTVSSSSVKKHTVENTVLLSSSLLPKSQSMHFVKPCPICSRVFTRRSGYQNHVKWCCKRDRFVERISSGIVRCRLCNSSYRKRGSCIKHLRQKHLLTNELICHTRDNAGTDVTGKTESTSTVTVSSSSVKKHTVENTVLLSSSLLPKSQSMHFVKPCPICSRVFTRRSGYQNHVKWCCKRDRFVERISSGIVRCRLCNSSYRKRGSCIKHLRQKHLLTNELICHTRDNAGTDVTGKTESTSTVTLSSSSVKKHTVENTVLLSSSLLPKSQSMYFVKPCPICSRVFTRRSGYQNHVKWCCKRNRFVDRISSDRVKCRLCNSTYGKHGDCIRHLRQKHLLTDESIYSTRDNVRTDVTEQPGHPVPTDDSMSASNANKQCSDDSMLDKTVIKMEH